MLTTELTKRFRLQHPIIQAGMGAGAGWQLAAAVSKAGALGTIGTITRTPEDTASEIAAVRAATERPFAVNLIGFTWAPFADAVADAVFDAAPAAVTLSFGDPSDLLARAKAAGISAIVQVQDVAGLEAAIAGGADAL